MDEGEHFLSKGDCCQPGARESDVPAGVTLSWKDINYSVQLQSSIVSRLTCKGAPEEKKILDNISGVAPPGKLIAIMGPSGCGKVWIHSNQAHPSLITQPPSNMLQSTCLDVLAGRMGHHKGLTGTVMVDGEKPGKSFKSMKAYVMQDDHLIGSLSVREWLQFSALLKLPQSMSFKEKLARVCNHLLSQWLFGRESVCLTVCQG